MPETFPCHIFHSFLDLFLLKKLILFTAAIFTMHSKVPCPNKPNCLATLFDKSIVSFILNPLSLGIQSLFNGQDLPAGLIIDAFWVQFFPGLWQVIHYCTALHLHYQLPLGLLANGTQIERRSWKAESCEVFSDPSCNAFTRQLPLILCTASVQVLKYKIICRIILQLFTRLHGFKFLQFLWCTFPTKLLQPVRAQKRSM